VKLRDYQEKCVESIYGDWNSGNSTLSVLPTGTGKTVIFGNVIDRWKGGRVLVLAHREELIFQASDKIKRVTGVEPDIEMADLRASRHGLLSASNVVVSSIQTQVSGRTCKKCGGSGNLEGVACWECIGGSVRRMQKFDPEEFGMVVVDEAHHACAPSYRAVIDYYRRNLNLKVLGVTATPDRADEKALGQIFESVAFEYGVLDAISDGWLVPITQEFVSCEHLDFSACRTTAGDLNQGDLQNAMIEEQALHEVVSPTIEIAGDRATLFFTVSVAQAELYADILNRHKPGSAICIHGGTPTEDRRRMLREFSRGEYQYLCGCGVFLEGFDEPRVEVVAMARPTKSRALYAQAIGRGTRPINPPVSETPEERRAEIAASVKPSCLVLDFVGNSGRHKLISTADILGGNYDDSIVDLAVKKAKEAGGAVDMRDLFEEVAEEQKEQRRKSALIAVSKHQRVQVNPFDVFDLTPKREPAWHRGRKPSERMVDVLRGAKIPEHQISKMSFTEASSIIGEVFRRRREHICTYAQAKKLAEFGQPTDVPFEKAREILDAIAANNWQPIERMGA
jgi:superfamily II DNA or RNA helicase